MQQQGLRAAPSIKVTSLWHTNLSNFRAMEVDKRGCMAAERLAQPSAKPRQVQIFTSHPTAASSPRPTPGSARDSQTSSATVLHDW
ncbi:hypothetical protein CC80DRAFT_48971 [Byssothecium circinans]|uniref:Uncharacterized protein n=1 Tax=Byssothecium circinans TaxID=147558 RepID=A0A6A5U1F8_9PLEO|nr:hypothetical protein CC80DRAFT_48971 [Byssothecium circinans]